VRNGITMASRRPRGGGVNGRKLRLIVEDDAYDPARAATAVAKLVNEDRVFAILSPLGTPMVQAALLTLKNRTLYLSLSPPPRIAGGEQPNAYAMPPVSLTIGTGLRAILNQRGPLSVGILSATDSFGAGWQARRTS
jgi:ABC-type branched-subunit amino acid transport system substrate-binding protein